MSLNTGLVAYYSMVPKEGSLLDYSNNGNHGTIYGALSTMYGMNFDGASGTANDYIDCGNSNDLNPGTGEFTICTRLKKTNFFSVKTIAKKQSSYVNGWTVWSSSSNISLLLGGDSYVAVGASGITDLSEETTLVITLTKNGSNLDVRFYVDGVNASESLNVNVGNVSNSEPMLIAHNSHGGGSGSSFGGEINDFRIYNRPLTDQEVKDYHGIFNKQYLLTNRPGLQVETKRDFYYAKNKDLSNEPNLVAAYNFIPS